MYSIKEILQFEVSPALGCTEPAAVALCTSAAQTVLGNGEFDSIELWLSPNIYKNAFAVAIPGTEGAVGIDLAAVLGAIAGDPDLRLEVLEPADEKAIKKAMAFLDKNEVKINLLKEKSGIYIRAKIVCGSDVSEAEIEDSHDRIVSLKLNGEMQTGHPLLSGIQEEQQSHDELEAFLKEQTLASLLEMINEMDEDDYTFIQRGVDYNLKLAQQGLTYGSGLGIGRTLEQMVRMKLINKDMILQSRILTSAACDARMSGVKLPAMSSAGSGNHGLTAVLPVWAVKDYIEIDDDREVLKAIALSHLVTGYIKAHTGRLSAVCGCSVAAGAGATAGVTYLLGGSLGHIAGAIKNLISDLAGVICDGAKSGCALKLSTAAGTAVQSALLSLHGINVKESDGIIDLSPEKTIDNMGELSNEGMIETDRTILKIMMDKALCEN